MQDYAVWLRGEDAGRIVPGAAYRLQAFKEEVPVLQLPTDYARPVVRQFEGDHAGQVWSEQFGRTRRNTGSRNST
ncbi:hypothetical protein ACFSQ7_51480 [Paenibacillus rhizoplanae]